MRKNYTILIMLAVVIILVLGFAFLRERGEHKLTEPRPGEQQVVKLTDGRQCYTYTHDATTDEPYTVTEFIDMTINGNKVAGTKTGTQSGPDMHNGYTGSITGTLDDNAITDVFAYTIEGSMNKEREIYRAGLTGIEKLRYPLIEQRGLLVPDTTQEAKVLIYARVGCTASN